MWDLSLYRGTFSRTILTLFGDSRMCFVRTLSRTQPWTPICIHAPSCQSPNKRSLANGCIFFVCLFLKTDGIKEEDTNSRNSIAKGNDSIGNWTDHLNPHFSEEERQVANVSCH